MFLPLKLPNPDRAVVDIAKLRDYCLNPRHADGKHKAHLFAALLGLTRSDAQWLRQELLKAAHLEAKHVSTDMFGPTYAIDFRLQTRAGEAVVRSGWIVRYGEDYPRLTTCYIP